MTRDQAIQILTEAQCTDGGCLLRPPGPARGMRTNGGCHCLLEIVDGPSDRESRTMLRRKIQGAIQALRALAEGNE